MITGGHLGPGVGVIPELLRKNWDIYFFGRKHATEGSTALSFEYQTIAEEMGIKFYDINPGRVQKKFSKYTIPSLLRIPVSFIKTKILLFKIKPDVILTFGSYVGVPVAVMGWFLRIPVILHIQTIMPGRADKIIARFAKKIAVSWVETIEYLPKDKTTLTGDPVVNF